MPITAFRDIVGANHVLVDDEDTARYRVDWTRRYVAPHATVVRPGDPAEVVAIIELCRRWGIAVVPQGGNTGLVAGGIGLDGELCLSTERLRTLDDPDSTGALTAGAGVTLEQVQRAADHGSWQYGVNIASRSSATIGGNVATNAGGLRVVRHGDTRRQVRGVEIVTGSAQVVRAMPAALRDNTGYHLPSLVTGSEGSLGVITEVCLGLVPRERSHATALVGFATTDLAARAADRLRALVPPVAAIEVFVRSGLELVCTAFAMADPLAVVAGAYVLFEVESADAASDLEDIIGSLDSVLDTAIGIDSLVSERLWAYRERHTDAIATVGIPHKLDVAVPPGALGAFLDTVPTVVSKLEPDARTWLFGHGGEGSVHVNVTGLAADDERVDDAVLDLVVELGGSISAEHGIGRAKLRWVPLTKGAGELATARGIKAAFDPDGIMNPAVLIPR